MTPNLLPFHFFERAFFCLKEILRYGSQISYIFNYHVEVMLKTYTLVTLLKPLLQQSVKNQKNLQNTLIIFT